jgi:beta-lactamase class A
MSRFVRVLSWLCALCLAPLAGADGGPKAYPDLRDRHDPVLQRSIGRTVDRLGLTDAVNHRKLALTVVDITDLKRPRVAALNGDEMMYAASMPKVAILLGAFVEIERGRMQLDAGTRDTLTRMIRVSSNEAATTMLRRVGKQNLADILMSERFRLYDPVHNGGLWVGKEYGPGQAFRRDPLHNISHGATAMQTARLYYMLESGQLLSPRLCREMKEILGNPGIHHKFVKGLDGRPDTRIYRKSGTWEQWHADSAIVERDGHKYIIVAMAEDRRGGDWLANLIRPIDDLLVPTRVAAISAR